jgi:NAD-dependent DNA ligase
MMENQKIVIPTNCPSCDSILEDVNGQLFCRNNECPAQNTKAVQHFAKVLKIKGLGPKTILKLDLNSIADIYSNGIDHYIETMGELVGTKLYKEIADSRKADLQLVLQALGINRIGETASKKICSVVSHINEITEEKCKEAKLGQVDTEILIKWLKNNQELIESLPFDYRSTTQRAVKSYGSVCITGTLKDFPNRESAKIFLEERGYTVTGTVTAKTTALICEEDKISAKVSQAKAKNIPILTIEKLLKERNQK